MKTFAASVSRLGSIKATPYCSVASEPRIEAIDTNVPRTPKLSAEYKRLSTGIASSDNAWPNATPVETVRKFFTIGGKLKRDSRGLPTNEKPGRIRSRKRQHALPAPNVDVIQQVIRQRLEPELNKGTSGFA